MMSKNINYGELQKYMVLLRSGNAIAARMENGQISEHTAKVLFGRMIETLAEEIRDERD
jgi:hypothetical protein